VERRERGPILTLSSRDAWRGRDCPPRAELSLLGTLITATPPGRSASRRAADRHRLAEVLRMPRARWHHPCLRSRYAEVPLLLRHRGRRRACSTAEPRSAGLSILGAGFPETTQLRTPPEQRSRAAEKSRRFRRSVVRGHGASSGRVWSRGQPPRRIGYPPEARWGECSEAAAKTSDDRRFHPDTTAMRCPAAQSDESKIAARAQRARATLSDPSRHSSRSFLAAATSERRTSVARMFEMGKHAGPRHPPSTRGRANVE
jgi:hypothetical protein